MRVSYTEAIEILEKSGQTFEFPVAWGHDLQSRARTLPDRAALQVPGDPLRLSADDQAVLHAASTTTSGPCGRWTCWCREVGEIIGGSQREERLDVLEAPHARAGPRSRRLLVVPRPAPLRHRAALRLRPGPGAVLFSSSPAWPTSAT